MNKVCIVYWSGTGNTEAMAGAVLEGVKAAGAEGTLFAASEFDPNTLGAYDAAAFGCPSMGCEQLEDSEFEPMFSQCESMLSGKKIALFGSYGWGDGEWMRNWKEQCENDGAVLASDPVICNDAPSDEALAECRKLGGALA
ncbi:MAG: flavodoxin [Lachnospiraceae bacterium]|nr:flavodoxin [Lachnospiraceae bacterium]